MKFSVICVTLNPGEKLRETVSSVLGQTYKNIELIIKDGGSNDNSLDFLDSLKDARIKVVREKDKSIYDGMNMAVREASGDYYIFLNSGDLFADDKVLAKVSSHIIAHTANIVYGNLIRSENDVVIPYPSAMKDFDLFRNVPCHQVCFYDKAMFMKRGYDLQYKVRSDYEHFLYCVYVLGAKLSHIDYPIAIYEGGGFSETKDNLAISKAEHKAVTKLYMGKKVIIYRLIMIITLQPLREKMASSKAFSGVYQKIKGMLYGR